MSGDTAAAAAGEHVPVVHSLSDIYADAVRAQQRYTALTSRFLAIYQHPPLFYARAPGRVNLIGEHVDYCGYSVLPMAIDRDTVIAVAVADDSLLSPPDPHPVQVANYDSAYPPVTFNSNTQLFTVQPVHSWTKYIQCGFKGVFNDRKARGDSSVLLSSSAVSASPSTVWEDDFVDYKHHSLQLMVSGTVPPSAGLSSSSSLVCASALTAAFSHSLLPSLPAPALASIAAQCERYVGTMGGGMDQAISFMSQRGVAQRIDFDPLHATPVSLPPTAVFLVCNSLYDSEKAVQAARQFNARVLECKLAALLLARHFKLQPAPSEVSSFVLRTVQQRSNHTTAQLVSLLASSSSILHEQPYTVAEVETALGVQLADYLSYNANFAKVIAANPPLHLRQRALHVYSEAQRVYDFQAACDASSASSALTVSTLGRLMDESHASCRDQYDCSCDDLERLVRVVKEAGALGCRLTGAGWGGCVVALFDGGLGEHAVSEAQQRIQQTYYVGYKGVAADDPRLSEYMFTTTPASGAAVYVPEREGVSGESLAAKVAAGEAAAVAAVEGKSGSMSLWKRTVVMIGLGLLTGAVIALLTRHHNRRLAHATTTTTSHAVASGALGSAMATPSPLPVLR